MRHPRSTSRVQDTQRAAGATRSTRHRSAIPRSHIPGRFHRAPGPFLTSERDGTPMPSGSRRAAPGTHAAPDDNTRTPRKKEPALMTRSRTAILAALALVAGASHGNLRRPVHRTPARRPSPAPSTTVITERLGQRLHRRRDRHQQRRRHLQLVAGVDVRRRVKVTNGWNAKVSQSGAAVTADSARSYNRTLSTGSSASFGFQGTYGSNAIPATFTLNGAACNVDDGSSTDPDPDPTDPDPTDPPD